MVSGVGGGAVRQNPTVVAKKRKNKNAERRFGVKLYAPLQGVLSDRKNVQIGYWVAFAGYVNALTYGIGMCIDKERRKRIDSKTGKLIVEGNVGTQPAVVEDGSEKSATEKSEKF